MITRKQLIEPLKRVVVTGIGCTTTLGLSVNEFWSRALKGEGSAELIPDHWREYTSLKSSVWSAFPKDLWEQLAVTRVQRLQSNKSTLLALHAAREAACLAGLRTTQEWETLREKAGVFVGTGIGGIDSSFAAQAHHVDAKNVALLKKFIEDSKVESRDTVALEEILKRWRIVGNFNPLAVSLAMPNSTAAALSLAFGIQGQSQTVCQACASGTSAVGLAFKEIQRGSLEIAVAGGCEYLADDTGSIFKGFDSLGALTTFQGDPSLANRPFDEKRSGFLFSEGGAAFLILEEYQAATARGATPLAEIIGFAQVSEAHHMISLNPSGAPIERLFQKILQDADIQPEEVNYINAHGTGTMLNDAVEAAAIQRSFGEKVLINSTKSLIGHSMGASGAIEALVTVKSIYHQRTHPSRNIDISCAPLRFVQDSELQDITVALSHSFAFGGHNSSLAFRRV